LLLSANPRISGCESFFNRQRGSQAKGFIMSKLIHNRWLRWSLLVAVLIALGVGIDQIQPPEAMCEIEGDLIPRAIVPRDRLVTATIADDPLILGGQFLCPSYSSPISVWDATTGVKLKTYVNDKRTFLGSLTVSKDGRRLAALEVTIDRVIFVAEPVKARSLVLIDLDSETTKEIALDETIPFNGGAHPYRIWFSAEGMYVVLAGKKGALRLFECDTGRLVATLEANRLCMDENGIQVDTDFSNDLLLYYKAPDGAETDQLRFFKPRTGQPIPGPAGFPWVGRRSADWRHVFAWRPKKDAGKDWAVWNIQTGIIEGEFSSEGHAKISDNGKQMIMFDETERGGRLELREMPTSRLIAALPMEDVQRIELSPDSRCALLCTGPEKPGLVMLEIPTLTVLWKKEGTEWVGSSVAFSRGSDTVFVNVRGEPRSHGLDTKTGAVRWSVVNEHFEYDWTVTEDRGSLRVVEWNHTQEMPPLLRLLKWVPWLKIAPPETGLTVVYDADTCRERFRLHGRTLDALLSNDGGTLATSNNEKDHRVVRCWAVGACKPLRWAVGVPAGLGAVVVLYAWRRRRRAMVKNAAVR
jgi:hypothetical protein